MSEANYLTTEFVHAEEQARKGERTFLNKRVVPPCGGGMAMSKSPKELLATFRETQLLHKLHRDTFCHKVAALLK